MKGAGEKRGVPIPRWFHPAGSMRAPNCGLADPGGQFVIPDAEKPSKISHLVPRASAGDEGVRDRSSRVISGAVGQLRHPLLTDPLMTYLPFRFRALRAA